VAHWISPSGVQDAVDKAVSAAEREVDSQHTQDLDDIVTKHTAALAVVTEKAEAERTRADAAEAKLAAAAEQAAQDISAFDQECVKHTLLMTEATILIDHERARADAADAKATALVASLEAKVGGSHSLPSS
jgi:hypothetical protein